MAASTMQLDFSQAMSDFKTMFPDMDCEVIEAVLRANQGAVDATIDQLLQMSTDNQVSQVPLFSENEKLRNELDASISPQRSLINLSDTLTEADPVRRNNASAQLIDTTDGGNTTPVHSKVASASVLLDLGGGAASPQHHHNTGASPKLRPPHAAVATSNKSAHPVLGTPAKRAAAVGHTRRWNPPILGPLPPGFLRIAPSASSHDAATRDFELPDEQFALMLQNEEFMNQLRWNQEFMNALEKEQTEGKAKGEDDAAFKERLKHMGKVSRKKFLQMARVFTWQRNKKVTTAKQIDSLPLKEEPSDDEEHHHNHHRQQQQQQHNKSHQQQPSVRK